MTTTTHHRQLQPLTMFVITSVLLHALMLCIPLNVRIPHDIEAPKKRLIAVELLPAPQAEDLRLISRADTPPLSRKHTVETSAQKKTVRQALAPKKTSTAHPREATVSLDRLSDEDTQYRTYLGHVRSKIGSVWNAPSTARQKGLDGIVTVRFTIARNGELESLAVKKKSSHNLLDSEALRIIRQAAPFMPFPADLSLEKLHVLTSFVYEFNSH